MMSRPFMRRGGRVEVALVREQRELLADLLGQVDQMLDDGDGAPDGPAEPLAGLVGLDPSLATLGQETGPATTPDDPAVARLLPDGSRDDPEVAAEFRRLTEQGLRARKRTTLREARAALSAPVDRLLVERPQAEAVLKGLTDLRLVLAERLGIRTDEDAERLHAIVAAQLAAGKQEFEVGEMPGGEPGESAAQAEAWVAHAALYDLVTWWQESLVEAMLG
jgi:hypothetical protein